MGCRGGYIASEEYFVFCGIYFQKLGNIYSSRKTNFVFVFYPKPLSNSFCLTVKLLNLKAIP